MTVRFLTLSEYHTWCLCCFIPFLGEKGMEIEGNLKISKFQVLSSASVFF